MESYPDHQATLAIAERAAAAPYVDYPPTPRWYPFSVGAWAALLVLAYAGTSDHPAVFIPAIVVLLGAEAAFLTWYRRYRQTMPSLRNVPKEIGGAFTRYAIGATLVLALCVAVYVLLGGVVCAVVTFVVVTAGLALYERDYARAAAATRERLGD